MNRIASTNQGSNKWVNHCHGLVVNGTYSPSGKNVNGWFCAKMYRMISPSQNTGMEMPISASTVMTRSDNRPAVTAEMTPTTTPKKSQMIPAPMQSENVAGMPLLIWSTTLSWLEYEMSVPLKRDFIIPQYWS